MGRDKARLRIGTSTLLTHARRAALAAGLGRVRTLRHDLVPRCGPLGGIITALRTTRADAVLFMACDMPFVTAGLLRRIARSSRRGQRSVAATQTGRSGFPLLLPASTLPAIERQVAGREFSLQRLLTVLAAQHLEIPARSAVLFNINTPEEARAATARLRKRN